MTGLLQFHENGDRVCPPVEIVTVARNQVSHPKSATDNISQEWQWQHLRSHEFKHT